MTDSTKVPGKFDAAFEGTEFMLDYKHAAFRNGVSTIPLLRSQADSSSEPGEASTNPEDLWPRSQHSFHKGSGQTWLDVDNGDAARFLTSKGVTPWTRGKVSALPQASVAYSAVYDALSIEVVGDYLFYTRGSASLYRFNDITTNTSPSATLSLGDTATAMCSDGSRVYVSGPSLGINYAAPGDASVTAFNDLQASLLGFCKGRLMAAKGNSLYNVTTSGAGPASIFDHFNTLWTWTCFGEGTNAIYAGGYANDKSSVYSITIKDDGTALNAPKVACRLPDGEVVHAVCGYLGYVAIGTSRGFRIASEDGAGNLTLGALVQTPAPVKCFEPQGQYIWYGLSKYDSSSTGLGRMDMGQLTANNVPAYTSDLMVARNGSNATDAQDQVVDVATCRGIRVFAISETGLVIEKAKYEHSSYIETSEINFGILDNKVAVELALEHDALPASCSIAAYISVDGGSYTLVGTSSTTGSNRPTVPFPITGSTGAVFKLKFVLTGTDAATPTLNHYTFRTYPVPSRGRYLTTALLLHENYRDAHDAQCHLDPGAMWDYVQNLADSGARVRYQELGKAYDVFIDELQFERHSRTQKGDSWNGTLVCKMKVLGG